MHGHATNDEEDEDGGEEDDDWIESSHDATIANYADFDFDDVNEVKIHL